MREIPFHFVQISDIHFYSNPNKALLGVQTHESFKAVLDLLKQDKQKPEFILLTGDVSHDGSEASYLCFADLMKEFQVPIYVVPGNHDDSKMMSRVYPRETISTSRQIVLKNWQLILLDSQIAGKVEGYLAKDQLKFLNECLQQYPEHHAIISFHHQPIPVGSTWLDNLGLTNANELWNVVKDYPRVHTILFGHVHQEHSGERAGIKYFSPPSTCIQFKTNSSNFALENIPPGYRWVDLYPDGKLKTGIKRCAQYVGVFDKDALGY